MITNSNSPYKRETATVITSTPLLAQRPVKEDRMSIVCLFYHVLPAQGHEQALNHEGLSS